MLFNMAKLHKPSSRLTGPATIAALPAQNEGWHLPKQHVPNSKPVAESAFLSLPSSSPPPPPYNQVFSLSLKDTKTGIMIHFISAVRPSWGPVTSLANFVGLQPWLTSSIT